MEHETTISIPTKVVSIFLDPIVKTLFKTLSLEVKNTFQNRIIEYTAETARKCYYVKTLFHKEKVALSTIYFPINLIANGKVIKTDSVRNIFKKDNKVIIVGQGGSGKTTLLKYLYLDCVKSNYKIPVLLNLRDFNSLNIEDIRKEKDINKKNTFFSFITDHLLFNSVAIEIDLITKMFAEGAFLFILDGYDELSYEIKGRILKDIESFILRFSKNSYLITSRPHTDATRIADFSVLEISGLDPNEDFNKFVKLQLFNSPEIANDIIETLNKPSSKKYAPLLSNPLFLILFINSYESYPKLPPKKSMFYWQVFDALYEKHDANSKSGYRRPKQSKLLREDFEYVLNAMCFLSYFEEKFEFTQIYLEDKLREIKRKKSKFFEATDFIEDLKVCISLLIEDGDTLFFVHRTLQEYFATRFISNFTDIEMREFMMQLAKNQQKYSSHTFLIELISELYEKEFIQYFVLENIKAFIAEYAGDIRISQLDATMFEAVLDSFEGLLNIISFSKEINVKFLDLIKKYQNNFNRGFEHLTSISKDHMDLLLSVLILERNWKEIEIELNSFLKEMQVTNRPFIDLAFSKRQPNE